MEHFLPALDHTEELEEMDRYEETQLKGILAGPGSTQVVLPSKPPPLGDSDFRVEDACGGARLSCTFAAPEGNCASRRDP
jgi:hypothetical protein